VATGHLEVYSATKLYISDGGFSYAPHTDYEIYSKDGALFERVRNATDHFDEDPSLVLLPVGRYVVKAESRSYGLVAAPVTIENGRTTSVRLQQGLNASPVLAGTDAQYVRLPNGLVVGPRARAGTGNDAADAQP
jgi:hypothetical protein